jgi:hypothetical protein
MSARYGSKHVCFSVDGGAFTDDMLTKLTQSMDVGVLIALRAADGQISCYLAKTGGGVIDLRHGAQTLAKKMGCNDGDDVTITLKPTRRGMDMPVQYLKEIGGEVVHAYGRYSKGDVEDIITPPTVVVGRDIPRGDKVAFNCHVTDKIYNIESFKGDEGGDTPGESLQSQVTDGGIVTHELTAGPLFDKKKHYYFYSKRGGYGKTTFMERLINYASSCLVTDPKSMSGISNSAQFVFVDDYDFRKRFDMPTLKGLTCGVARGFGDKLREDIQFIFLSNSHLFDSMGESADKKKDPVRRVSAKDANLLKQRFHIYRLDEEEEGDEEEDARVHTAEDPEDEFLGGKRASPEDDDDDDDDCHGPPAKKQKKKNKKNQQQKQRQAFMAELCE